MVVAAERFVASVDTVFEYARAVDAGEIIAGPHVRKACRRHIDDMEHGHERGLWFDEAAAQHALTFISYLNLEADKPFILDPFQVFIVGSLFGWKRTNGHRRFITAYVEIAKGNGKALALDTPIPTPDGWTTMGEIEVGDYVFDEHGNPARVEFTSNVMEGHPCYEVMFDDGTSIVADEEHLWYTEARCFMGERGEALRGVPLAERGKWRKAVRTTKEIAETLRYSNGNYQSANHSIPLAGPLDLPARDLPIDPYVLGAWLGDGDSDCARITIGTDDIEGMTEALGRSGVAIKQGKASSRSPRFRVGGLQVSLRSSGLLKNKHVPPEYLRASFEQRLALLQGLMDTDGYISPMSGQCEFSTTKRVLGVSVLELATSLGIKTRMAEGRATIDGRDVGAKYRVTFFPPHDLPVFRLPRKLQHQHQRHDRRRLAGERRIVECRPVASVPVRCIAIDTPTHLYLAGEGMTPTHNTPLWAAIGLYGVCADGQARAEVYSAAPTAPQSRILYADAQSMVASTPELAAELRSLHTGITYGWSFFRPWSGDGKHKSGFRPHMGLIDELHEHNSPEVLEMLRAGTKRDLDALIGIITNSGASRTSVCWIEHQYSADVVDGLIQDDSRFVYIASLDDGDDWRDENVWIKSNPGLGTILPIEYLRQQIFEGINKPSKQNTVKRLHCCIWTEQVDRWLDMVQWDECGLMPIDERSLRGEVCYAGLDLASRHDFTAAVFFFPDGNVVIPMFWVPEDMTERTEQERIAIHNWADQGYVRITEGNITDYDVVREDFLREAEKYQLEELAFDTWNATQLATQLQQTGLDVVPMQQGGAAMSEAAKSLAAMVADGSLHHGGNPILRYMAANVAVREDLQGNIRLDRDKSGDRIDGMAALTMAIARASLHEETGGWVVR